MGVLLSACGSTSSSQQGTGGSAAHTAGSAVSSSAATQSAAAAYIKDLFGGAFKADQVSPTVEEAFAVAHAKLSASQQAHVVSCLSQETCTTGHGNIVIGFADSNGANGLRRMWRLDALEQAVATPQVSKFIYLDANGDLTTYLSDVRTLINLGVNAIITPPDFGASIIPVIRQAVSKGIAVILTTNLPGATAPTDYTTLLGQGSICDNWAKEAQLAVSKLGSDKTYGLYTGPAGNPYAAAWEPCVTKVLSHAGWKQVASGNTDWTPQGEQQAVTALIASGKKPAAVFYDYNLEGFIQPFLNAHAAAPAVFGQTNDAALWQLYKKAAADGQKLDVYVTATPYAGYDMRIAVTAGAEKAEGKSIPSVLSVPFVLEPLGDLAGTANVSGYPSQTPMPADVSAALAIKALGS